MAQAYYDVALARLEALRGRDDSATRAMRDATRVFQAAGLEGPASEAQEAVVCTMVWPRLARARDASDPSISAGAVKDALALVSGEWAQDHPVLRVLAEALELVLAYLPSKTVEDIAQETSNAILREVKQQVQLDVATAKLERQFEGYHLVDPSALGRVARRAND